MAFIFIIFFCFWLHVIVERSLWSIIVESLLSFLLFDFSVRQ